MAAALLAASPSAGAPPLPAGIPGIPRCLTAGADAARGDRGTPLGDVPAARRATLARGVNVTDLFGPGRERDVDATFRRLRLAGIRHVRIPVSAEVFADNPPPWQAEVLRHLDQAVCSAMAQHLGIVIDLHWLGAGPKGETVETMTTRLAEVWRRLAGRYGRAPADGMFFEVLNEPKLPDERQWEGVQNTLVRAIRSVAPANTVIATASPWSTAAALAAMVPLGDRNVVYAFHFYTPMIFTHQGAAWSLPNYASVDGLVFPARPDNVAEVARHAAPDRQAELADYGRNFRDTRPIETEIQAAANWAQRYGTVLAVTEFGVYDKAAPLPARAAWLAAVRRTLKAHDIGWTVWEYQGGFGIADDLRRGCTVPDSAVAALDLCGS
jgi:endoglucanase